MYVVVLVSALSYGMSLQLRSDLSVSALSYGVSLQLRFDVQRDFHEWSVPGFMDIPGKNTTSLRLVKRFYTQIEESGVPGDVHDMVRHIILAT